MFLKIEELESHQAAIIEALKEDEEGLESVRNSMQNNMAIMRENLANLRARIEAVKK